VWDATSQRYIDAYERLTGLAFQRGSYPVEDRIREVLGHAA
jgi:phosphoribosylaminoimidazole-succinocarboxamide synthase